MPATRWGKQEYRARRSDFPPTRINSPGVCDSAWRSRSPSCTVRTWSSPTSRPRLSMSPSNGRSSVWCRTWRRNTEPRCSGSLHDLSVVAGLADDIAVMYAGRIVETGTAHSVLDNPMHPYTRGLIESVPSHNRRGQKLRQIPGTPPNPLHLPSGCAFRVRCGRADAACRQEPPRSAPLPGRTVRCFHPTFDGVA